MLRDQMCFEGFCRCVGHVFSASVIKEVIDLAWQHLTDNWGLKSDLTRWTIIVYMFLESSSMLLTLW